MSTRLQSWSVPLVLAIGVVLALLPALGLDDYWQLTLADAFIFAVFGLSYNIVLGQIGLFSLSHALFFGLAGYFMTYFQQWGFGFAGAAVGAVVATTAVGLLVSLTSLRIRDLYFSLATLVIAQLCYEAATSDTFGWSGGENGRALLGIPERLNVNISGGGVYYLTLVVLALSLGFVVVLGRSPLGRIWHAIRENRTRAASLGIDVTRHQVVAFTVGSALAAVAGVLDAILIQIAVPDQFALTILVQVLLIVMIGGPGTVLGPVVGAAVVRLAAAGLEQVGRTDWVAGLSPSVGRAVTDQSLVLGVLYVVLALFFPAGLAGVVLRGRTGSAREGTHAGTARKPAAESAG
jgi:branched-chain amino acid transport system permease protein